MPIKKDLRSIRKRRIRKKIFGTEECPRLSVFRSSKHVSAQAIDDDSGKTIVSVSTVGKKIKMEGNTGNKSTAEKVGELVGGKLAEKGIKKIVFDRNGFLYHGRISALATGIRKKGIIF